MSLSLCLQTRSGSTTGVANPTARPALRAARAIIRQSGFTIAQAHQARLPGALAAWQRASRAASQLWEANRQPNQPSSQQVRLWVRPANPARR